MKTYSQKPTEVTRQWHLIDASNIPLGRLSTEVAKLLSGKHKPTFTPHTDGGDFVVIINTDHVGLTGAKEENKTYYRHSGFPGNLKETTASEIREKDSTKLITLAVSGMLPKNKLQSGRLERLKLYTGTEHNHAAQKPVEYKIGKGK